MKEKTDSQLLGDYPENRSEAAFAELVKRHVDFVYSAALRLVCDSHLAEDVTQTVFVALGKNARQLTDRAVLSGWLHCTAHNIAAQTVRTIERRRARELEAAAMNPLLSAQSDTHWKQIAPHLDEALEELSGPDRDILLLSYFEGKSAREMAEILGIRPEAAQKRATRAIEKLRGLFAKRGITVGESGLAVVIAANAVQAAPLGLAVPTSSAATLVGTTLATTTTATVIKTIAMTTLQKTVITATLAVLASIGIYEARQTNRLREENQKLRQERAPLVERFQRLERGYDEVTNRLAALLDERGELNRNTGELLKLRAEVGRLRIEASPTTPAESAAKLRAAQVTLLKQRLKELPNRDIPELQFVTDKEWANAAWDTDLETEDGIREALSKVRDNAEETFMNQMRSAIERYLAANQGVLPAELSELKPYFKTPVTDEMLQRYNLLQTGKPSQDRQEKLVELHLHADEDYDSNREMSLAGGGGGSYNRIKEAIRGAADAFARDNQGQRPRAHSQIQSYLQRQIDPVSAQKYLNQYAAEIP